MLLTVRAPGVSEQGLGKAVAHDDFAGLAGFPCGELELVGGLGIAHRHARVGVAVDGGQHGLQGGILIESAHGLAVDLELVQILALVIHPVAIGVHPVALGVGVIVNAGAVFLVHRLDIALCLHLLEFAPINRFIPQQLAQGLGGVHIGGRLIQAQRLGGVAGDGEGGARLVGGERQGDAVCILCILVFRRDRDRDLALAEGTLDRLVKASLIGCHIQSLFVFVSILRLRQLDLLGHTVKGQGKLLAGEVVAQSGGCIHQINVLGIERGLIFRRVDAEGFLDLAGGAADGHGVAGGGVVGKYDVAIRHLHLDLFAGLYGGAVAEGHGLLAQLASDGIGHLIDIRVIFQLAEVDGVGAVAAVFDGQGAGDVAQLLRLGQIHRAAGKFRLFCGFAAADAGDGVGGRLRQLLHA